ncbi:IS110 family RNA-guided transposase, partial [Acetobacter senegalensis]|uniref:IS110 family transposase n=2 Tax=Acetobacter TaxID=434 RepID=UPI001123886A
MKAKHVGLDIAKSVFQAHGTDANGKSVFKCKLGRSKVSAFFAKLGPFEVVLEACGSAHYWAWVISRVGHDVRLVPPDRVKPFIKKGKKNDAVDAAAICMAATHPDTIFVPIKSEEQQGVLSLHSTRALLVKQQTMLSNALRALASEFGLIAPLGTRHLPELMIKTETSVDLSAAIKQSVMLLFEHYEKVTQSIDALEAQIRARAKSNDDARRLMSIPRCLVPCFDGVLFSREWKEA